MAEIQIDDDWKKQAQEEKRRLAEQQKAQASAAPATAPAAATSGRKVKSDLPSADFEAIVQQVMTQALYYLGELSEDERAGVDLDGAKYQIDLLSVLEVKTAGNLTKDEQSLLDSALYDLRSRYVSIATQMIR
ncbi:MAG: DUF1844 domain-containing protein [Tepidisphaeraceae bacterium]